MSTFSNKLRGFLTKIFAISLLAPIVTCTIFCLVGIVLLYFAPELANSTSYYVIYLAVVGLIAVLFLPFFPIEYCGFGSLGLFFVEILENSLDTAMKLEENLIFLTAIAFLAIPLIGMCFLKKRPMLYRLMVYVPLMVSMYLSLRFLYISDVVNLIMCIKDGVYLLFAIILDFEWLDIRSLQYFLNHWFCNGL